MLKMVQPNIEIDTEFIKKICENKEVTNGENVKELEDKIAELHDVKYSVATNSGTMAFYILFNSLPIKVRKLAMPSYTWFSIKQMVKSLKVDVTWADVNPSDWIADFGEVVDVDLLMPTLTFGNYKELNYSIPYIVDATHCTTNIESSKEYKNENCYGGYLSFSPAKSVTAMEGGMILTNNKEVYESAIKLRRYMGRMGEINAHVALNDLKKIDEKLKLRKEIVKYYSLNLTNVRFQNFHKSNFNALGVIIPVDRYSKLIERMKDVVQIRKRYTCEELPHSTGAELYKYMILLPMSSMEDCKKVVELIKDE